MIRVVKPNPAPAILRNRGKRTTEANNAAFDAEPDAYRNGERRFSFDGSLYGAKSVRSALIRAQHGKCAFCEAKLTHITSARLWPLSGVAERIGDAVAEGGAEGGAEFCRLDWPP